MVESIRRRQGCVGRSSSSWPALAQEPRRNLVPSYGTSLAALGPDDAEAQRLLERLHLEVEGRRRDGGSTGVP